MDYWGAGLLKESGLVGVPSTMASNTLLGTLFFGIILSNLSAVLANSGFMKAIYGGEIRVLGLFEGTLR